MKHWKAVFVMCRHNLWFKQQLSPKTEFPNVISTVNLDFSNNRKWSATWKFRLKISRGNILEPNCTLTHMTHFQNYWMPFREARILWSMDGVYFDCLHTDQSDKFIRETLLYDALANKMEFYGKVYHCYDLVIRFNHKTVIKRFTLVWFGSFTKYTQRIWCQ